MIPRDPVRIKSCSYGLTTRKQTGEKLKRRIEALEQARDAAAATAIAAVITPNGLRQPEQSRYRANGRTEQFPSLATPSPSSSASASTTAAGNEQCFNRAIPEIISAIDELTEAGVIQQSSLSIFDTCVGSHTDERHANVAHLPTQPEQAATISWTPEDFAGEVNNFTDPEDGRELESQAWKIITRGGVVPQTKMDDVAILGSRPSPVIHHSLVPDEAVFSTASIEETPGEEVRKFPAKTEKEKTNVARYSNSFFDRQHSRQTKSSAAAASTESDDGKNALHLATEHGHQTLVAILLDRMVDVNAQDAQGRTALHLAVMNRHEGIVRALLARQRSSGGGSSNTEDDDVAGVNIQDHQGNTALHVALQTGQEGMAEVLLRMPRVRLERKDALGRTPLHLAVLTGADRIVRLLLDHHADIDARVG